MRFHPECAGCLLDGQMKLTESVKDEALRNRAAKEMCRVICELDTELNGSPVAHGEFIRIRRELLGIKDDYSEVKKRYNALAMSVLPSLREKVNASPDPFKTALLFSLAGNYVDFGVIKDVSEENMLKVVSEAADKEIDESETENLKTELSRGGEVIFLHDNCGEIAFDRLFIETILRLYPKVKIVSVVRGAPVINDVTEEDARDAGLYELAEVITNGLSDMGGTPLHMVPESVRRRIESAPVVISKGMGNFETLIGSGINAYYLFLAKCPYYTRWYGLEHMQAVLANDRRLSFR